MALFTDGPAATIEELTEHDSSLLEVSAVEGINLTTKLGLAQEEVRLEMLALLERDRNDCLMYLSVAAIDVRNVVVTSPIRLWQTYQALVLVYRDAYFSQLNDRYKAKWGEYRSMAKWAKDKLIETGIGVVTNPIAQAGVPSVLQTPAAESGGTFYVSVSFVNAAGEEGMPSASINTTTADGNAPDIQAVNPPRSATGWNLYAGAAPEAMYRQNTSPLDLGTDSVFYPSVAITTGVLPGNGQAPNFHKALPRLLQRG